MGLMNGCPIISYLILSYLILRGHYDGFFDGVDEWVTHVAEPLDEARKQMAPKSELIMNE